MKRIWILLIVAVTLSTASMSFGSPVTWYEYSPFSEPVVSGYYFDNIIVEGKSNFGAIRDHWDATTMSWAITDGYDGKYMRLISDGNFGSGTGNGSFTMAFDFYNQGSSNISQIVYTGHASEGVSATITQVDFFSSAATNNEATASVSEDLAFITSPSEMCVANRLSSDGYYFFHNGVWYFVDGVDMFTTQSNFSFSDIVRVQYTFSITGFTAGKFIEFDAVSNTNDPVPIAQFFDPVSIYFPPTNSVPEPATMLLFGVGLAGLGIMRKRIKG